MQLYDVIWKERYIQKLENKHAVLTEENVSRHAYFCARHDSIRKTIL